MGEELTCELNEASVYTGKITHIEISRVSVTRMAARLF